MTCGNIPGELGENGVPKGNLRGRGHGPVRRQQRPGVNTGHIVCTRHCTATGMHWFELKTGCQCFHYGRPVERSSPVPAAHHGTRDRAHPADIVNVLHAALIRLYIDMLQPCHPLEAPKPKRPRVRTVALFCSIALVASGAAAAPVSRAVVPVRTMRALQPSAILGGGGAGRGGALAGCRSNDCRVRGLYYLGSS